MRMLVTCLLGSVALGFAYEKAIQSHVESLVSDTAWQRVMVAMAAVLLGSLFGWCAKGIFTVKKM